MSERCRPIGLIVWDFVCLVCRVEFGVNNKDPAEAGPLVMKPRWY
jgi:hypothetical protein